MASLPPQRCSPYSTCGFLRLTPGHDRRLRRHLSSDGNRKARLTAEKGSTERRVCRRTKKLRACGLAQGQSYLPLPDTREEGGLRLSLGMKSVNQAGDISDRPNVIGHLCRHSRSRRRVAGAIAAPVIGLFSPRHSVSASRGPDRLRDPKPLRFDSVSRARARTTPMLTMTRSVPLRDRRSGPIPVGARGEP